MSIYDSHTYLNDLQKALDNVKDVIMEFKDSSVLITGASGLVCSPICDLLFLANEELGAGIRLYLAGRSEMRMRQRFPDRNFVFVQYDASGDNKLDFHAEYVIHGASNSGPADISSHGIETMLDNFEGMHELLEYAVREKVRNTLYISSSEVYGKKNSPEPFKEYDYGWVDILSPRSSYPSSKRAAETLCACYSKEMGIRTVIVRPGHIYGPTARRTDSHVSAVFAFEAADGENIVMKSDGRQNRSWCYCLDSATAILTVLVKGKKACAYNISNPDSESTIKDMAYFLADEAGVMVISDVPSEVEKESFNPMTNSSLDSSRLQGLGWKGLFDAKVGFTHTIRIIREADL